VVLENLAQADPIPLAREVLLISAGR
jgi:hypothetical protein